MNENQKMKRKWRASKAWKNFRKQKMLEQKGVDLLTRTKLTGRWSVHHRLLTDKEEEYCDISRPEEYLACLSSIHDLIHLCLRYVKKEKSMDFMNRLYDEIKKEAILNGYIKEETE